ncbi:MAG TPA: DUF3597 domain-containing protein [Ramlibacter sp.]
MSILGNIFGRIFHRGGQASQPEVATAGAAPSQQSPAAAGTATQAQPSPQSTQTTAATATQSSPQPAAQPVDVEAVLNEMAKNNPQKLNWRTSIVDLMKLLDLDSSLQARKQLADELHYTGDKNDSATMNIWLHKQVMRKVAENGGKVPADLKD